MPERWERELAKLRHMEMKEPLVRERIERGPTGDRPPRGGRLAAGVVAAAVAVAAGAFLWQAIPGEDRGRAGGSADDLPTLLVTFESAGPIDDDSGTEYPTLRVDTTIAYGDARESSFTSTIAANAHVDWVAVEDLTRFVPGPAAGSPVRIEADGEDPRVSIGDPAAWPEFDRFTPIERIPDEPGEYVLLFEATYADGIARTARLVRVVPPGTLQIDATAGAKLDQAASVAYVDGERWDGFLSASRYAEGDFGVNLEPRPPDFSPDQGIEVPRGSALVFGSKATTARAGLFEGYGEIDLTSSLPLDLLEGRHVIDEDVGSYLLAIDVVWRGIPPDASDLVTSERALFLFPIEIVDDPPKEEGPEASSSPIPSPSPSAAPSPSPSASLDGIVVSIFGLGERSDEMPIAIATFRGETKVGCTEAFEWTLDDGTKVDEASGRNGSILPPCSYEPLFRVPPGVPITLEMPTATEVFATRTTTPFYAGRDGFGASVRWADGQGDFLVMFEVKGDARTPEFVLDCPEDDRIDSRLPTVCGSRRAAPPTSGATWLASSRPT